jgi:pimeloyl-ACP methyl ester carboxylesterase
MSSPLQPGLIAMADRLVNVDGVELCLETFGDPADPPVLLISGGGASMDWWDAEFCERLAAQRRLVVRYDHRDTGRSAVSAVGKPTYTSDDLSSDPIRVLDALGIPSAHLVGVSMGGGIAQYLAARHADRVLTITLIATSPAGERLDGTDLPPMHPRIAATFDDPAPEPAWDDRTAVIDYLVEGERPYAGSLGFDEARTRRIARTVVDRTRDIAASTSNHWAAEGSSDEFRLADIRVPTLVLHGTADPLFPIAHGEALAAEIPGATLVRLSGMGHEIPPPQLWDVVVSAIVRHTTGASAAP